MENTFGMNIIPDNDEQRILALKRYQILDTPPEGAFDNVAKLATEIFDVPISLISLVDAEQVFFKANIGMGNAKFTSRGVSLCSLAVLQSEVTIFENAPEEPCLLANPNVAGSFGLKFYAGAPLTTHDGFRIGTLCIIDKTSRTFGGKEEKILAGLAKIVMDEIELRLAAITETDNLQEANEELSVMNEEMTVVNEEIRTANEALLVTRDNLLRSLDNLKISEERFRALVAQAPVAITIYNGADLIIEQANSAHATPLGSNRIRYRAAFTNSPSGIIGPSLPRHHPRSLYHRPGTYRLCGQRSGDLGLQMRNKTFLLPL